MFKVLAFKQKTIQFFLVVQTMVVMFPYKVVDLGGNFIE